MKKLFLSLILLLLSTPLFAWQSETGGGVVSANANVVLTSIEATQVLKSDALSNLLGETDLGGAVNYASFNSGGVLRFINQVSSRDTVILNNDQYLAWLTNGGNQRRIGISTDNYFIISSDTNVIGKLSVSNDSTFINVSLNNARINVTNGIFTNSSDTNLTNVSASNVAISSTLRVSGSTSIVMGSGVGNASGTGTANINTTDVGNVGAGDQDLITYSLPANSLSTTGRGIRYRAWGTAANNANAKTVNVRFGSQLVAAQALAINASIHWSTEFVVFRTGANTQDYVATFQYVNLALGTPVHYLNQGTAAVTDTASISIRCSGNATANNDIVQSGQYVEYI